MGILSSIAVIGERWILQSFGGSTQQGFFSLALRISSVGLVFATALSSLLIREVAILIKKNDINSIAPAPVYEKGYPSYEAVNTEMPVQERYHEYMGRMLKEEKDE